MDDARDAETAAASEKTRSGRRTATVAAGTRWSVAAQFVVEGSRLAVQLVLARLLAPGDFGIVTLGMVTIVFLDIFTSLGTAPAIVQRPTLSTRLLNSMFLANSGLGIVAYAVFWFVAPSLASSSGRADATELLRVLGLALVISSVGIVQQGLIRRELEFRRLAGANITQTVVSGGLSLGLAFGGMGPWSLVWGQLAGRLLLVVLLWRMVSWKPRLQFDLRELLTVREFSVNLTLFNIANYFFLNADRFLVGRYLGAPALGIYGLGQQTLMTPVRSITRAVQQVLFPTFSRMQDDDDAIGRGYLRACAAISALTFPAMGGLAAVADPLVRTIFDERWVGAIPVVTILAPVGLLHSLHFTSGVIFNVKGRTDLLFRWGVASGAVTLVGYVIGLRWGVTGVAAAYAVVVVLLTYPAFALPFRLIDLRFRSLVVVVAPYGLATLVMAGAVLVARVLLRQAGVGPGGELLGGIATGAVVYGSWVVLFRPSAYRELAGIIAGRAGASR